ncbi:prephenate dehydratase domain-containing protein [Buchnera aphidicola]|uniref:Bifunctional chorismate mutase/prephenate dehydratase n=1 Tax=Buchnera aphidicola subsp. Tuberolachnus salignus TaxID=98804 RepID=A0A160SW22_BUCTT|nr:prephenate dehydratase domain-containing protein [Buchnera aphidicola]CUR53237.1 P-protein [Buchnera aphidicola (Tuberolachnus salignus)]
MKNKNFLKLYRNGINYIDNKILKLLSQRKILSINILFEKIKNNLLIQDIQREKKLLNFLEKKGILYNLNSNFIKNLFLKIIENSISVQKELQKSFKYKKKYVCKFLGPKGSYSHLAFNKILNTQNKIKFFPDFIKSFQEIKNINTKEKKFFCLLPINNTITGIIPEVYNILKKKTLYIIQEIKLPIKHALLTYKNIPFYKIKNIYSHNQPFLQCSKFLKNFPHWKKYYFNSTTEAMKKIFQEKNLNSAVLGNENSGQLYNLKLLSNNISNKKNNITRFFLLTTEKNFFFQKNTKISIIFQLFDYQKKIEKIYTILLNQKCTILKILSYIELKKNCKKNFLIDIQIHETQTQLLKLSQDILKITKSFKILNFY